MTVFELVAALNGEIVRGQARYRAASGYVILGKLNGDRMEFTEEGRKLADDHISSVVRKQSFIPPKPAPKTSGKGRGQTTQSRESSGAE